MMEYSAFSFRITPFARARAALVGAFVCTAVFAMSSHMAYPQASGGAGFGDENGTASGGPGFGEQQGPGATVAPGFGDAQAGSATVGEGFDAGKTATASGGDAFGGPTKSAQAKSSGFGPSGGSKAEATAGFDHEEIINEIGGKSAGPDWLLPAVGAAFAAIILLTVYALNASKKV